MIKRKLSSLRKTYDPYTNSEKGPKLLAKYSAIFEQLVRAEDVLLSDNKRSTYDKQGEEGVVVFEQLLKDGHYVDDTDRKEKDAKAPMAQNVTERRKRKRTPRKGKADTEAAASPAGRQNLMSRGGKRKAETVTGKREKSKTTQQEGPKAAAAKSPSGPPEGDKARATEGGALTTGLPAGAVQGDDKVGASEGGAVTAETPAGEPNKGEKRVKRVPPKAGQ